MAMTADPDVPQAARMTMPAWGRFDDRARGAVSCGCRRADPDVRQAARVTVPARRRVTKLSAPAGRQAEPGLPFPPGAPPAAR